MKLKMFCARCKEEVNNVEFNNSLVFRFTCSKGHLNVVRLQNQKYTILFEFGMSAIKDGYYREAITCFASSLERFYEYGIYIMSLKNPCDQKDIDSLKDTWKMVASQSERQFGAFLLLYFSIFLGKPISLSNHMIELRNNAVHNGYIPTKAEAIKFGDSVASIIKEYLTIFRKELSQGIINADSLIDSINKDEKPEAIMSILTTLNNIVCNDELTVAKVFEGEKIKKIYLG